MVANRVGRVLTCRYPRLGNRFNRVRPTRVETIMVDGMARIRKLHSHPPPGWEGVKTHLLEADPPWLWIIVMMWLVA